jgi:hypothetical protein
LQGVRIAGAVATASPSGKGMGIGMSHAIHV